MASKGRKGRKSLTENSHRPKRLKRSRSYGGEHLSGACMVDDAGLADVKSKPLPKSRSSGVQEAEDYTKKLSLEMLCKIMHSLPLWDIMKLESLSHKLHEAVSLHLRLVTSIDFVEGELYGWMPQSFTDATFMKFLQRCPDLEVIYGFHPRSLAKRKQRGDVLSIPGVIAAFKVSGLSTLNVF